MPLALGPVTGEGAPGVVVRHRQDDLPRRLQAAGPALDRGIGGDTSDPDVSEQQTIQAVLASLPETQRSALVLRDQLGLSYEDVAGALHKSLPATKVTIHRARAAFRRAYEQEQ